MSQGAWQALRPRRRARALPAALVAGTILLAACAWLALRPVRSATREQVFEIPAGTWARRMAGAKTEILPATLYLTVGVRDVLVLWNRDQVPQQFGPVLLMPGQRFQLPFAQAARYDFACTAHLSGQMAIVVEPYPATPWSRLRWRVLMYTRMGQWF